MKFQTRRAEEPEINLAPLIDVVFILLIFFMVATTFDREVELKIQLPEAAAEQRRAEPAVIELVIDASSRYFVDGRQVVNSRVETLTRALAQAAEGKREPMVILTVDAQAPHQAVITAMDAARREGLTRLTFTAREPGR